jgi:hypothetical protein
MGARSILTNKEKDPVRVAQGKALAAASARWQAAKDARAKAVLANALVENHGKLGPYQVGAIAKTLRRSRDAIKDLLEEAREELAAHAGEYVQSHIDVVRQALADGDPKALEVAARASQWAMEKISFDGARIVDAQTVGTTGSPIMIGINFKLGGRNASAAVDASAAVLPPSHQIEQGDPPPHPLPPGQIAPQAAGTPTPVSLIRGGRVPGGGQEAEVEAEVIEGEHS